MGCILSLNDTGVVCEHVLFPYTSFILTYELVIVMCKTRMFANPYPANIFV